jgi:hypothetical protein
MKSGRDVVIAGIQTRAYSSPPMVTRCSHAPVFVQPSSRGASRCEAEIRAGSGENFFGLGGLRSPGIRCVSG